METDRELLELAAKAAGLEYVKPMPDYSGSLGLEIGGNPMRTQTWNPLTDDGDALRLAIKLNMELLRSKVSEPRQWVSAVIRNTTTHGAEYIGSDPYAAARRAIVRAAAAIGKDMQ